MSGLLLKKFSNKITEQVLNEFFRNLTTFSFNADTDVSNTNYFITSTNVGNTAVFNNEIVMYYTGSGGTPLVGLVNNNFYKVTSANSTGFMLANVSTNSTIALISGDSETHYIATHYPAYYFVLSKHSPWENENIPDTPRDNLHDVNSFQREMILGKRIDRSDVAFMVRRINWVSGTVYSPYDDTDLSLFEKDFYVITDEENVYKCLDNNNGAPSVNKPTGQLTTKFQTSDNYVWKYMYTLSATSNVKFSTAGYMPVDSNTTVSSAAVNGSIEFVQITTAGEGYLGFATGLIQQVITNTTFKVETSATSGSNGYYNTSGFYIKSGTGSGQLTVVNNYIVNTSGHYIETTTNLDSPMLDTTSVYLISPQVRVVGDGTGFKAYANVAVENNRYSISSIEILNRGQNYSYCVMNVVSNPAYGNGAVLRPVFSPEGGHGYNQPAELGSAYMCISKDFANSESLIVSTNPAFRKTGIIYGPKQSSNGSIYFTNATFNALYSMSVDISTEPTIFEEGEIVVGQSTNAHAIAAWSNATHLEFSYQHGSFDSSETIIGQTSGAEGIVVSINSEPDINKFTNDVIYYDYFSPIQRSNTTTETAKLLIAI